MRAGWQQVPEQVLLDWWTDVVEGRRSRTEAADWAQDRLTQCDDIHELVHIALQQLNSLALAPTTAATRVSGGSGDTDVLAAQWRQRWQEDLHRYHTDPAAWDRTYWSDYLRRVAGGVSPASAERVGQDLVAQGLITTSDVRAAIDERKAWRGP